MTHSAPRHRIARASRLARAAGILLAALLAAGAPAGAVEPNEMLDDPALEARAREVSKGLRCVVCQNESIDESNAEMARDMRVLVRDRILAGDSNAEVEQYLVDRYGDYVLLKPPFKPTTYVLWFGPALILLGGAVAAVAYYRRKATGPAGPAPLSPDEEARLHALIGDDEAGPGAGTRTGRDQGGSA
ncbi:cytochrome c-type biogenesis protein [Roseospira goensis]|uniref:Cytochrome c-type biogenesis protein n=1 Tax=Roseospira goensis TaxID=391922 RepID=A0A7W6S157_9PROT|nr:cytochrome c-type biogenesis protein [Roseospira goensis]MBB4286302.1 cytochrome c-type biogenesis protein CcmH [Roseospira goensis]